MTVCELLLLLGFCDDSVVEDEGDVEESDAIS